MVGSALVRKLDSLGYKEIETSTREELDLTDQTAVRRFFELERPDAVVIAAAKVGGIGANSTYPADFIYENLVIATNQIHAAFEFGVKRLLFLGSSCILSKACSATHAGRLFAYKRIGAYQRALRHCQNCRP